MFYTLLKTIIKYKTVVILILEIKTLLVVLATVSH